MVKSIPEKDFLKQEIKELELELDIATNKGLDIIDEIKKELNAKINRFNFITKDI